MQNQSNATMSPELKELFDQALSNVGCKDFSDLADLSKKAGEPRIQQLLKNKEVNPNNSIETSQLFAMFPAEIQSQIHLQKEEIAKIACACYLADDSDQIAAAFEKFCSNNAN